MSGPTLMIEVAPGLEAPLRRALEPVLAELRARLPGGDPADAALVVGAPPAGAWGRIAAAGRVIVVPAGASPGEPFLAAALRRAAAVCALAGAPGEEDLPADVPRIELALPAPPAMAPAPPGLVADQPEHLSAARVLAAAGRRRRRAPLPPIRLVTGSRPAALAQAHEAWASGAAPIVLPGSAHPEVVASRAALVCRTSLEAIEAVELLAEAPRLARALARMGRRRLKELPSAAAVADRIAAAVGAAARV